MHNRLIGGRRLQVDEKEQIKVKTLEYKDKYEQRFKGKYERIFPLPDESCKKDKSIRDLQARYDHLILCSKEVWGEQLYGGGVSAKHKIAELERKNNFNSACVVKD